MAKTTLEVFQSFGEGLMSGTDSWKSVVSDQISFVGPVDQVNGIDAFAKLNEAFLPMVRGAEMKQIAHTDKYVITQQIMKISMPTGKIVELDMSEWYEISDEKIQSIKIFYDAEEFRKELVPQAN